VTLFLIRNTPLPQDELVTRFDYLRPKTLKVIGRTSFF